MNKISKENINNLKKFMKDSIKLENVSLHIHNNKCNDCCYIDSDSDSYFNLIFSLDIGSAYMPIFTNILYYGQDFNNDFIPNLLFEIIKAIKYECIDEFDYIIKIIKSLIFEKSFITKEYEKYFDDELLYFREMVYIKIHKELNKLSEDIVGYLYFMNKNFFKYDENNKISIDELYKKIIKADKNFKIKRLLK